MNIPAPDEKEKSKSIKKIIKSGLIKRKTVFSVIFDLACNLGIKNIFWGVGDCILTALACTAVCLGFWTASVKNFPGGEEYPYSVLFMITPLFYVSANILSALKESSAGILEIKAACKYTPSHLAVFRMMTFSAANMILVIPPVAALSKIIDDAAFLKLLLTSYASLLIYSFCSAALLCKTSKLFYHAAFPAVWVMLSGVLNLIFREKTETLLMNASITAFVLCIISAAVLYMFALDKLIKKEENNYAYG